MKNINEKLITDVFNAMVSVRPALQKYLLPDDEDDEDATVDTRILGDLIIKNFPWPIGVELRRLFSGSMRQLDRMRLDQLFKTIERTMQFVSFVMMAQLWDEIKKGDKNLKKEYAEQFKTRFSTLSMGNFAYLIRACGNYFQEENIAFFMPEMNEKFNNKFYAALDFWVPERNEIGHYQINLTQEEIEKRCVEYEDKLSGILQTLSFLIKYKLVTIREIKVNKPKYKEAQFVHVIDLLNSSDSDFKATELNHHIFSDSNSVLLMKDIKSPAEFLNLSPLVIDTRTETIDSKEKFNLKKDIFLFTKFQNNKVLYAGTEVTEKCDLSTLSSFSVLVEQYQDLYAAISGNTVAINE